MSEEGKRLAAEFANLGLVVGCVFLLRPHDAIRLIDAAQAAGVHVYGIDGFLLHPGPKIQPVQGVQRDGSHEESKAYVRGLVDAPYCIEVAFDRS